jgi:lysophospholipase L1-like esterase
LPEIVSPTVPPKNTFKFDFGSGEVADGYIQIRPEMTYDHTIGYGFLSDSLLAPVQSIDRFGEDPLQSDFCTSEAPFYFLVDLPEGNYRVRLTTGDKFDRTSTTVKAELRRLMLENVQTRPAEYSTWDFLVNVRTPALPDGGQVILKDREKTFEFWAWDDKLTLEFNGERPAVCALEIAPADNTLAIYLLGDSTVCDQPLEPYNSWGQMLTRFFKPEVVVANHGESGESYRSSLDRRRFDKIMSLINPGDYLFLQFGHNDMKESGDGVGPFTSFESDIKFCVTETRKKGGVPVLVTPMQRRNFDDDGKVANSHGDYPEAVRQAAAGENVPLIDLHQMSTILYEAFGPDGSGVLFSMPSDRTHHNNYGSYQLAKCVVEGIKSANLDIGRYLIDDLPDYDPQFPDPIEVWDFPPSPKVTYTAPEGD